MELGLVDFEQDLRFYTWRSLSGWFCRLGAGLEILHLEELELGFVGWELELGILHLELELGFVYVESAAAAAAVVFT